MSEVRNKANLAKQAAFGLGRLSTEEKNQALLIMADALIQRTADIMEANAEDLRRGKELGTSASLLDRLALNEARIEGIAEGLRQIVKLPDPIGDTLETIDRPNGLNIVKKRVPLGVIGIIYEARPNVTVDAAGLCLKTGNAVVLRGVLPPSPPTAKSSRCFTKLWNAPHCLRMRFSLSRTRTVPPWMKC